MLTMTPKEKLESKRFIGQLNELESCPAVLLNKGVPNFTGERRGERAQKKERKKKEGLNVFWLRWER